MWPRSQHIHWTFFDMVWKMRKLNHGWPASSFLQLMLSHCPSQVDNSSFRVLSLLFIHPMVMLLPLSAFHLSSINFVSLLCEHGRIQLERLTIFTSLNQQVLFLQNLRETSPWLKHELPLCLSRSANLCQDVFKKQRACEAAPLYFTQSR